MTKALILNSGDPAGPYETWGYHSTITQRFVLSRAAQLSGVEITAGEGVAWYSRLTVVAAISTDSAGSEIVGQGSTLAYSPSNVTVPVVCALRANTEYYLTLSWPGTDPAGVQNAGVSLAGPATGPAAAAPPEGEQFYYDGAPTSGWRLWFRLWETVPMTLKVTGHAAAITFD